SIHVFRRPSRPRAGVAASRAPEGKCGRNLGLPDGTGKPLTTKLCSFVRGRPRPRGEQSWAGVMPRSVPIELVSFRRTFALPMVLVAAPSAGLPGVGVVAILNERAAVEKRLASVWQDRLDTLSGRFRQALDASTVTRSNAEVRVPAPSGLALSGPGFRLTRD